MTQSRSHSGADSSTGGHAPAEPARLHHGRPEKRRAIVEAALSVFLDDGYARASMERIASAAGVSNRTIYNHFVDKRDLFVHVVTEQRDVTLEAIDHLVNEHLRPGADLEPALISLFQAWANLFDRQLSALRRLFFNEAAHFGDLLLGPSQGDSTPTQRALADQLARLAREGALTMEDASGREAAAHLVAVVIGRLDDLTLQGTRELPPEEMTRIITSGVRMFLRAYRP